MYDYGRNSKISGLGLFLVLFGSKLAMAAFCGTGTSVATITPTSTPQTNTVAAGTANGKRLYWTFTGTAGVVYNFDLHQTGTGYDSYMRIYNSGLTEIASNDDWMVGYVSAGIENWSCPATGTYYVFCTRWNSTDCDVFNSTTVVLDYSTCVAPGSSSPPYTANFQLPFTCLGWTTTNATEASWFRSLEGKSGGPVPEGAGQSNNCICSDETIILKSLQINTTGIATLGFTWQHSLWNGSASCCGSSAYTVYVETSADNSGWTTRWSRARANGCGSCAELSATTQSISFAPASNTTWIRFRATGRLFNMYGWFISTPGVLPVDLLSFSGEYKDDRVVLNWQTATEMNNDYFTVERSADGMSWGAVGTVKGAGNSSSPLSYEFTDAEFPQPAPATLYYRLRQNDYNGQYEYFGPVSVKLSAVDEWEMNIINPVAEELNGTLIMAESSEVLLEIIDLQGRAIQKQKLMADKGSNLLVMDIRNLDKGLYFIRASGRDNAIVNKFAKEWDP